MNHHRTDLLALIFGMMFAVIGLSFLVGELTSSSFDPGWVTAVGLIATGVVALAVTLLRPKNNDAASEATQERSSLAGVPSVGEAGIPPSSSGDKEL
jgi:hypothetical protein